ncbi:glycoside hydrolase family 28 protein [Pisolithus tinctorius]|uniref:endo-polygalacturonase n=1 Tax=Pisolithus tinctorius Marx 270 TaxID=870435 RepID=A0A0C3KYN0_PISTI|nr:glycoside hydrolase family 28 protein [Pisolithus tinctorius]KIO14637.1 glycoside hydrolase family 28 protein [Pisolithus tinctorius Marx 270]
MYASLTLLSILILASATSAGSDCTGVIQSLNDVASAVQCKTVNIYGFTVPANQGFVLNLLDGTTVNVYGDIEFSDGFTKGPLFTVTGNDITFNGNDHKWNGSGPSYWDGKGGSGGLTKPNPVMSVGITGTFSGVYLLNSPMIAFEIWNGPLIIDGVTVDNREGNYANSRSDGVAAGRNTDGFDVGGDGITIQNCVVINQDDCIAISWGTNITVHNNYCESGHGISLTSSISDTVIENIVISNNTFVDSEQALRIKTSQTTQGSRVSNVVYTHNSASGCTDFGVLITQSYPAALGTPGNGVDISNVTFSGLNNISTTSSAYMVAVNCGVDSCIGPWDWSGLATDGGKVGPNTNCPEISGFSY